MNPINRIISQKGGNVMVNAAMVQDYAETTYRINSDRIDNLERKVNKIDSNKKNITNNYYFNGSNNNITINN